MNSNLENPKVESLRDGSIVCRFQIVGFVIVGLLTFGIHGLVLKFGIEGETFFRQVLSASWFPLFWLTNGVSNIFGWPCEYGDMYSLMPWSFICLAALINGFFFLIMGTFLGWIFRKFKAKI